MASVDTTRVIAAVVGLAGFAVALVAGLAADNPFNVVISRALIALVACTLTGQMLGLLLHAGLAHNLAPHRIPVATGAPRPVAAPAEPIITV